MILPKCSDKPIRNSALQPSGVPYHKHSLAFDRSIRAPKLQVLCVVRRELEERKINSRWRIKYTFECEESTIVRHCSQRAGALDHMVVCHDNAIARDKKPGAAL
jgi:hypothetical protein